MSLWALEELLSANQAIVSFVGAFGQSTKDVIERYKKHGGVIRYVLEQLLPKEQDLIQQAINGCTKEQISQALLNSEAMGSSNKERMSHKLVHMTSNSDFSQGPQRLASA